MNGWFDIEQCKRTGHYTMPVNHFHDHYEIYYLLSGERFYFIHHQTHLVQAGDLVLIDRRLLHKTINTGVPDHERILVSFDEAFIDAAGLCGVFRTGGPVVRRLPGDPLLAQELMQHMLRERQSGDTYSPLYIRSLLTQLLIACARAKQADRRAAAQGSPPAYQSMSEIARYMNEQFAAPLTLSSVARRFGFSPAYVSRTFKQATGFSFVEYLNNVRVREAQRLLAETSWQVIRIAGEAGFQSIAHFGRVFKQISGRTPLQYRRYPGRS